VTGWQRYLDVVPFLEPAIAGISGRGTGVNNVVRINLNAGWQWDRVAEQHYATYGAGIDWRAPDNVWTLTAEVFGQLGARQDAIGVTEPRFQVGLRRRPIDELWPQYLRRECQLDYACHSVPF